MPKNEVYLLLLVFLLGGTSILSMFFAITAWIKITAMEKSTHKIEYIDPLQEYKFDSDVNKVNNDLEEDFNREELFGMDDQEIERLDEKVEEGFIL